MQPVVLFWFLQHDKQELEISPQCAVQIDFLIFLKLWSFLLLNTDACCIWPQRILADSRFAAIEFRFLKSMKLLNTEIKLCYRTSPLSQAGVKYFGTHNFQRRLDKLLLIQTTQMSRASTAKWSRIPSRIPLEIKVISAHTVCSRGLDNLKLGSIVEYMFWNIIAFKSVANGNPKR